MSLFKNEVGRPSNETLKKRKIFYCVIVIVGILLLGIGGFALYRNFSFSEIKGNNMDAKTDRIKVTLSNRGELTSLTNIAGRKYNVVKTSTILTATISHSYPGKMYYSVRNAGDGGYGYGKELVKCSQIKKGEKKLKVFTLNKEFENLDQFLWVDFYSDSKCQKHVGYAVSDKTYYVDTKKPEIEKACIKNNQVVLQARDNLEIKNVAWTTKNSLCSLASKEQVKNQKRVIDEDSGEILYTRMSMTLSREVNANKKIKVCVWDLAGRLVEKEVSSTCN